MKTKKKRNYKISNIRNRELRECRAKAINNNAYVQKIKINERYKQYKGKQNQKIKKKELSEYI